MLYTVQNTADMRTPCTIYFKDNAYCLKRKNDEKISITGPIGSLKPAAIRFTFECLQKSTLVISFVYIYRKERESCNLK